MQSLQVRHAELLQEIEAHRPFRERFAAGAPDPTTTAEMTAIMERTLGRPDGGPSLEVECRADVCQILAPDGYRGRSDWELTLRRSTEFASRVGEQSTGGSGHAIMFPLRDRPSGESKAVLVTVLKQFRAGPAVQDCWARHKHEGRLDVGLWIGERNTDDDDSPTTAETLPNGLTLSAQGPLTSTAAGRCLVEGLRDVALRAAVPKHQAAAQQWAVFFLPPRSR